MVNSHLWWRAAISCVIFSFCAAAHAQTAQVVIQESGETLVDVTFSCRIESSGSRRLPHPGDPGNTVSPMPCAYRLYQSRCQNTGSAEHERQFCQISVLMEFEIGADEKKTITHLPAGFRHCVGIGHMLPLDECIKSSIAH